MKSESDRQDEQNAAASVFVWRDVMRLDDMRYEVANVSSYYTTINPMRL